MASPQAIAHPLGGRLGEIGREPIEEPRERLAILLAPAGNHAREAGPPELAEHRFHLTSQVAERERDPPRIGLRDDAHDERRASSVVASSLSLVNFTLLVIATHAGKLMGMAGSSCSSSECERG